MCAQEMRPSLQLMSSTEVAPTADCRGFSVYEEGNAT